MKNLNGVKFVYQNEELTFEINRYAFGNAGKTLAITITSNDPEAPLYAILTTNFPGTYLQEDEILVKTWSENKDISDFLRNSKFFEDTGKRIPTGYVEAEIWKIK